MKVLEVTNLTKIYGERKAVNDISFEINSGEIFGFLGANGAGKSTTLKMLCGLANITVGDAKIMGFSVKNNFEKAISNVGAIIEYPQFYEYMSAYKNLKFFAKLDQISTDRVNEVLHLVGLDSRKNDLVKKFSLGMKQRLGIAQALLLKPKLLLLDEPTNGLDANAIRDLRTLLKYLCQFEDVAILVSSHILPEMENLCDRVAIINNGKIIDCNTMSGIKKIALENGNLFIKVNTPNYAGSLISKFYNLPVKIYGDKVLISSDESKLPEIITMLSNKKILVYGAGEVETRLEDVFVSTINKNGGNKII